jgi:hypothetical protein
MHVGGTDGQRARDGHYRDYRDPATGDWLCLKCGKYTDDEFTKALAWPSFAKTDSLMRRNGDARQTPRPGCLPNEADEGGIVGAWDFVRQTFNSAEIYPLGSQYLADNRGLLGPPLDRALAMVKRSGGSGAMRTRLAPAEMMLPKAGVRNCTQCGSHLAKGKRSKEGLGRGRCSACDRTPLFAEHPSVPWCWAEEPKPPTRLLRIHPKPAEPIPAPERLAVAA